MMQIQGVDIQPLDGLKVIDVSSFLAGPFCSTQLAEFGADVVKLEMPKVGDALRRFGSITPHGDSLPWLSETRNKKSATLDLRTPEGAELLKALIKDADVLVENFQPGTLEKWGLGWDVLKEVNPRLIMVRISGYGQTGPYSPRPGFGRIGNAFGGLSYLAGYPDRPPVTPGSATIPDYLAGLYGALGVLLCIQALAKTGRGQVVDIVEEPRARHRRRDGRRGPARRPRSAKRSPRRRRARPPRRAPSSSGSSGTASSRAARRRAACPTSGAAPTGSDERRYRD